MARGSDSGAERATAWNVQFVWDGREVKARERESAGKAMAHPGACRLVVAMVDETGEKLR